MRVAVVERAAVVGADDEETHRLGVVLGQYLTDGEKVAQALGHFFVVHPHKTVVHPETRQRFPARPLGLGNLVFVVRKLQVGPAAMDVKGLTQQRATHGRTLDVPTRTPLTIGSIPSGLVRLTGFRGFPEHKIQWIVLVTGHRHPLTGAQVVQRLARQLAVPGKPAYREVHVTILSAVGQAFRFELTDQRQHLGHIGCGTRLETGCLDTQRSDVLVHGNGHLVCQVLERDAPFHSTFDDLVVDVRDVADVGHAVATHLEPALHHIEGHHHPGVPDVAQVVDGHAADIHAHMAGFQWLERLRTAGQGIENAQGHGNKNRAACASKGGKGRTQRLPSAPASRRGAAHKIGSSGCERAECHTRPASGSHWTYTLRYNLSV
ncbi:hypothetical protein Y695_02459 [Hydrogenophaga sp. T4]|nr:hypothetical protein Y695_02459 [Hydrogenophaga sp. T4]